MVAFSTAIAAAAAASTALQSNYIYDRQLVHPIDPASPQSVTTRWSPAIAAIVARKTTVVELSVATMSTSVSLSTYPTSLSSTGSTSSASSSSISSDKGVPIVVGGGVIVTKPPTPTVATPPSPPPPPPPSSPASGPPEPPQPPTSTPSSIDDAGYDGDNESSRTKTKSRSKKPVTSRRRSTLSSKSTSSSSSTTRRRSKSTSSSTKKKPHTVTKTVSRITITKTKHHKTYCSVMTVAPSIVVSAEDRNGAAYMNLMELKKASTCAFNQVRKITDYDAGTSVFTPDREWATHRISESYGFPVTSPTSMVTKASTKAEDV